MAGPAEAAGYAVERERGALIVALPSVMATVLSHIRDRGTLYDAAAAIPGAESFAGRGAAYRIHLSGEDSVVRHYRRGGAVARILHDEYLRAGEPRPLRELHASIAARQRGVDTPEVLAAIVYLAGPLYRADLATRFVPHSRDLADVTFSADPQWPAAKRVAAWGAAGRMLRTTFDAGVRHPDLNLRNILVAPETGNVPEHGEHAVRALLIDLDRASVGTAPIHPRERGEMLDRLHRSRRKLEGRAGLATSAAELSAFDGGLAGGGATQ